MVKYNRARRMSKTGNFGRTFEANWEQVPESLYRSLTGAELVILVDVLRDQYLRGMTEAEREACDQGYVWDARRQAMRDVA